MSIERKGVSREVDSSKAFNRREIFRSIAAMAALGQGQVSIARNYGLRPSEVWDALVEEMQTKTEEARRDGYKHGRRSAIPLRGAA